MSSAPVGWLAAFGGAMLVYSAIHDIKPGAAFATAVGGSSSNAGGVVVGGGSTPPALVSPSGPSGIPIAGPSSSSFSTAASSVSQLVASFQRPGQLVPIGYKAHSLAPIAAPAYAAASRAFGAPIPVTDSYRTAAQQAACHAAKPTTCAASGTSMHELGLAIDVDTSIVNPNDPKLVAALTGAGFCRYSPSVEPWHWAYGVCR